MGKCLAHHPFFFFFPLRESLVFTKSEEKGALFNAKCGKKNEGRNGGRVKGKWNEELMGTNQGKLGGFWESDYE